jgi:hypothetical protein
MTIRHLITIEITEDLLMQPTLGKTGLLPEIPERMRSRLILEILIPLKRSMTLIRSPITHQNLSSILLPEIPDSLRATTLDKMIGNKGIENLMLRVPKALILITLMNFHPNQPQVREVELRKSGENRKDLG